MKQAHRVMVFADTDNTHLSAQSFNRKTNWKRICDYLADPQEGARIN